jgi:hypothetical protein
VTLLQLASSAASALATLGWFHRLKGLKATQERSHECLTPCGLLDQTGHTLALAPPPATSTPAAWMGVSWRRAWCWSWGRSGWCDPREGFLRLLPAVHCLRQRLALVESMDLGPTTRAAGLADSKDCCFEQAVAMGRLLPRAD